MQGIFITFEGPEGAGQTTLLKKLAKKLEELGYTVVSTREPGGIQIAEQIRKVILDPENTAMDARTEALLYAASRRQHLVEKVIPALQEGKIVLCDRFIDSSLAYQGYARGIGMDEVLSINQFAIENLMPDITFYFDIDPEVGLKRKSGQEMNRLDLETLDFHQKVRAGYVSLVKKFPERIIQIDASETKETVFTNVWKHTVKFIDERKALTKL